MAASRYRIVLRGRLSKRFESAFEGMTLEHAPGRTVLTGEIRDQAQLYAVLDQMQDFGIELLSVESADITDWPRCAPSPRCWPGNRPPLRLGRRRQDRDVVPDGGLGQRGEVRRPCGRRGQREGPG